LRDMVVFIVSCDDLTEYCTEHYLIITSTNLHEL